MVINDCAEGARVRGTRYSVVLLTCATLGDKVIEAELLIVVSGFWVYCTVGKRGDRLNYDVEPKLIDGI
jgi:hypothetical protein